jgi:hypothetical protein
MADKVTNRLDCPRHQSVQAVRQEFRASQAT